MLDNTDDETREDMVDELAKLEALFDHISVKIVLVNKFESQEERKNFDEKSGYNDLKRLQRTESVN